MKPTKENVKTVEDILNKFKVEYEIKDNVITLTTRAITRFDGKGIKRRYVYDYHIVTKEWRSLNSDGSYNPIYYKSNGIKDFLIRFFKDNVYDLNDMTKYNK